MRLQRHQPGTLTGMDRYLHHRTGGMIGSLSHLIRGAAVEAILSGMESITMDVLEGITVDHAGSRGRGMRTVLSTAMLSPSATRTRFPRLLLVRCQRRRG